MEKNLSPYKKTSMDLGQDGAPIYTITNHTRVSHYPNRGYCYTLSHLILYRPELDEINLVFGLIQTVAIVAGVLLAIAELRQMRLQRNLELETKQIQLVNELSQHAMSLEGQRMTLVFLDMEWKDYDDFEQKYGSDNNPENCAMRNVIGNWYNLLGILVRYGIAEQELIFDWTGWNVIWGWNKFKDIWLKQRELYNMPERHENWELLYYEMKSIAESRGYSTESSMTPARYTDEMRRKVHEDGP